MALSNSDVAARLADTYKGIEGFYILNAAGSLGYFSDDGKRMIRETFESPPSETNPSNPVPADDIELFLSELRSASASFPPGEDRELGYLLPVDDATLWNTATLVLHDHIAKDIKDAFDRDLVKGRMSLAEGDRKISEMTPERGLHRGFDDLVNHIGAFGIPTLFPVLYFLPASDDPGGRAEHPMRVINLLSLITGTGRFSAVLARMRRNLAERGALNQASRVEHRFTLQE